MSEQYPDADPQAQRLAESVLHMSQEIRARERSAREEIMDIAAKRAEREGSAEVLLAGEVERLANRMTWLHEHPVLGRFIGKTALKVILRDNGSEPTRLETEPLTDGEIGLYRERDLVFSGLIFSISYEHRHKQLMRDFGLTFPQWLNIDQQIENKNLTSASLTRNIYKMSAYESSSGPRVTVLGGAFDDFRAEKRRAEFDKYAEKNSWATRWLSSEHALKRLRIEPFDLPRDTGSFIPEEFEERYQLNSWLLPRLNPPDWDYPDDLFLEPLALVTQANMLLGTKNNKQ